MEFSKDETDFVAKSIVKEELIIEDELIIDDELIIEDELITYEAEEDLLQERPPQSKPSKYFCETCNTLFSTKMKFRSHIRAHKPSVLPCSICGKTFKEKYLLERHLRAHERYNKPKEYRCEECDEVFELSTLYRRHLKTHESHAYRCSKCPKFFPERNFLRKHEKQVHNISPPPAVPEKPKKANRDHPNYCHDCDKTLKTRKVFVNHMRRHKYLQEGVFRCIPCDKPFADYHSLILHENRVHSKGNAEPQKPVELHCELCNEVFCSLMPYSDLRKHQRDVHRVLQGIVSGTVKRGTEGQSDLQVAIKKEPFEDETSENLQQNDILYSESIVKEELIIEDVPCEEETPTLHCTECDKSFSKPRHYYMHQRRHKSSAYSCSICQKSFKEKFELERHVKIHRVLPNKAVETELHCSECDKTFATATLFKRHMRTHGKPIHKCSICPKAFAIKAELSTHKRNVHQIVPATEQESANS